MSCIELLANPLRSNKTDEGSAYQLLLGSSCDSFSHKPQEVTFYASDGRRQQIVVEENLRVLDLCQLLALKFNVARSHTWTLAEQITQLQIERSLEDHEDILQVYSSWGGSEENRFLFRQDFTKYEFFRTPQQFFPLSMLDLGSLDCLSESPDLAKVATLQHLLIEGERSPTVQSLLWCREPGRDSWKRLFFRIEGATLCVSSPNKQQEEGLFPFRDLTEYDVYTPIAPTPTSYSFCLKSRLRGEGLLWLCCESDKHRQCWIVALRLAKYGRKIRENYKEVQSRHTDSPIGCNDSKISVDSLLLDYTPMKPRVAMDFTGRESRVVEDPSEAKAIAAAEGHNWKRRLPWCRGGGGVELGVHAIQPWFYNGLSRDEATHGLTKYGTVDGVFLVRESRRNPGSFVLSYVYKNKVHHCQIFPVEEKEQLCYSLDGGRTKFYDLLALVEFYQLNNLGSLPTKLTHFLVLHRPKE